MAQFDLFLSGTFHLTVDGQPAHPFRTDKARALLAFLVMEADRPLQRQTLAALFWPEMPTADALRNLRKTLHLVRQVLDAAAPDSQASLLTITRQSVQLHRAGMEVDMLRFQALAQAWKGHTHRHLHLCHDCLARLQQGVALYRGDFLAGFSLPDSLAFEGWTLAWQEYLRRLACQALRQLAIAHALRGEVEQARLYALRQAELDPYNEEAVQDLMRILAQGGQRGESLAVYERMEIMLEREMGIAPDVRTTGLRDEIRSATSWRAAPSPPAPFRLAPHYTPLVGRADQIVQIQEKLLDPACRLLTILGPGGMGKSRLATAVAERMATYGIFPEGIVWVPGLGICGADGLAHGLAHALAAALGSPHAQGWTLPTSPGLQRALMDHLAPRRCLLIVDDLEACGSGLDFLVDLLAHCPRLSLLVTARRPLHVRAEHQVHVPGLAHPCLAEYDASPQPVAETARQEAVQLFVQAAQQVQPGFVLTQANQRDVVRICELVQGMPLALKIAAGWVRLMSCAAIVDHIACPETAMDFLVSPLHDLPERHASLAALFDHAWQGLTAPERQALARLGALPGPLDLETALSVTHTSADVLASLLDQSMIQRHADGRLGLPTLLRHFVAGLGPDHLIGAAHWESPG